MFTRYCSITCGSLCGRGVLGRGVEDAGLVGSMMLLAIYYGSFMLENVRCVGDQVV